MSNYPKINYQEFQKLLLNTDLPDSDISPYIVLDANASGPFNPVLKANPELVVMSSQEAEAENAMGIGNGLARFRRQMRFKKSLALGNAMPVLVAEGDSWFQFPILIDDVVDQLGDDYLIWCVSAAGDTAQDMVFGNESKGKTEYMKALREQKGRVQGFLFSGAGNDILGADETGLPVISSVLKNYNPNGSAHDHINFAAFGERLAFLRKAYNQVIHTIHSEPGMEKLPIIIHGYDYALPWSKDDPRSPSYAKKDEWLGRPMADKDIVEPTLQRGIVVILIDALYDMLNGIAGNHSHVYVVDARHTLPSVDDWNDEIHGTSAGFAKIAAKFKAVIKTALSE